MFVRLRLFTALVLCSGLMVFCNACNHHGHKKSCEQPRQPEADLLDGAGAPPMVFDSATFYQDLKRHTFTDVGVDAQLDVSRDGTMLAYSSTGLSQNHCIFVKKLEGLAASQKTPSSSSAMYPRLSPDGRFIAFASNRNGNWDIWIVDAERNGAACQVTDGNEDEIQPAWSPDGKKIAYSARNRVGDWELRVADPSTGVQSTLGPGMFPAWSPVADAKHPCFNKIVFQRPRQRGDNWFGIWMVDANGGGLLEVHASASYAAINPSWSPDGAMIAFATVYCSPAAKFEQRRFDGDDIWVIRSDGTGLAQLTSEPSAEWYPCWSADGRIYFIARREGAQNIWSATPLQSLLETTAASGQ